MATIASQVTGAFNKIAAKQPDAIQTGTIQQPTPTASGGGPSDPTGGTAGTTPNSVSVRMAVFEIEERRIDGTNIQAGDYQVIVEPASIEVTLNDIITCDRGALTIAILGRVASGGQTALYDMVCRG
tara:strand:+ start:8939 stop:9319 length:381 start_codon:yes stop_codon:yes gene_type:complete